METQLFILKYWYELTGQQYSPTCTVHSHLSILLLFCINSFIYKKVSKLTRTSTSVYIKQIHLPPVVVCFETVKYPQNGF